MAARNCRIRYSGKGAVYLCYFLGTNQEAREAVNNLKDQTGYKVVTIRHMDEFVPSDDVFGDEAPYNVSPNDFIKYISEASYICTDSFHCTVFSIIFQRKFLTFYRFKKHSLTSRNSRIDSLLEYFDLSDRLYNGDICSIKNNIDYNDVNRKLSILREESIIFEKRIGAPSKYNLVGKVIDQFLFSSY